MFHSDKPRITQRACFTKAFHSVFRYTAANGSV